VKPFTKTYFADLVRNLGLHSMLNVKKNAS